MSLLRLQNDVLAEAAECGGRLLVMHEALAGGRARQVLESFEPVAGPEAVQTPRQVRLQRVGCYGLVAAAGCDLACWLLR